MANYATATFLSASDIVGAIKAVGDKRTIIIQGENGIGKTAIHSMLKADPDFSDHFFASPIVAPELTDGSVWMPDLDRENGVSRELPNERFGVSKRNQYGVPNSRPVVVFIDELFKAQRRMQQYLSPIIYDRLIGPFKFPERSVVIAATNLGIEGLGDSAQPHMKNRLIMMYMRKPTVAEWVIWARNNGIHPVIISAVLEYPEVFESFLDYEAGGMHAGKDLAKLNTQVFNPRDPSQDAYVTPRSLHGASDIMYGADQFKLSPVVVDAMLAGAVGPVFANKLGAFVRLGKAITPFDEVINDPLNAPINPDPMVQVVQTNMLVSRVTTRTEAEAASMYVLRMRSEMQALFTGAVNDSKFAPTYMTVPSYTKMLKQYRELM